MKEVQIKKKFKEANPKAEIWFAPKVKYKKESDIFGVFDCILWAKDGTISFWQLTSLGNISTRIKKVKNRIGKKRFGCPKFVAGWSKRKKEFKIIEV